MSVLHNFRRVDRELLITFMSLYGDYSHKAAKARMAAIADTKSDVVKATKNMYLEIIDRRYRFEELSPYGYNISRYSC